MVDAKPGWISSFQTRDGRFEPLPCLASALPMLLALRPESGFDIRAFCKRVDVLPMRPVIDQDAASCQCGSAERRG